MSVSWPRRLQLIIGRQKVLEWYFNSARYGRWIYGAETQLHSVYFGKSAADLNLAEAAMLAAVAEAPALNPIDAPQAAVERQRQVIQTMLMQGLITVDEAAQANQADFEHPTCLPDQLTWPQLSPTWFSNNSRRVSLLTGWNTAGCSVITSLDYDLQLQAACAAQAQIARLEGATPDDHCGRWPAVPGCPLAAFPVALQREKSVTGLSATVAVLDPRSGQVLALVGNPASGLDPAHLPGQPPGTIINPFIYFFAFAYGESPASLQWDIPLEPDNPG